MITGKVRFENVERDGTYRNKNNHERHYVQKNHYFFLARNLQ